MTYTRTITVTVDRVPTGTADDHLRMLRAAILATLSQYPGEVGTPELISETKAIVTFRRTQ